MNSQRNGLVKKMARIPMIFWGILAASILFGSLQDKFFLWMNVENILRNTAILLIVSIGMTMAILSGKIDLSVGGTMTFAGMASAVFLKQFADPAASHVAAALLLAVVAGAAVGAVNGYFIGVKKYDNWLISFATMSITFGLAQVVTGGNIISGFNKSVRFLGDGKIGAVSVLLIVATVLVGVMWYALRNTRFGMHIYAVGDSEQCAELSGVWVGKVNFQIYLLSGIFAGISGFLLLSKTNSMGPIAAEGYEFNAIAATIVGGTSFDGGKGGLGGTIFGALFIAVVKNGLQLIGFSVYLQQTCVGVCILAIILIDVLGSHVKRKKRMRRQYKDA